MSVAANTLFAVALVAIFGSSAARADKQTVCTITVNSADEKEMLRKRLPEDRYQFVELVERGRPDWLASACSAGVRCDVLVVSGHFDGSTAFYSDQVASSEYLPVAEMERASCSDSCPGLFSQLKEVYLFGCNTLNADAVTSVSPEIGKGLVRAGYTQASANRLAQASERRHDESSRDRMRRIFHDVPVIYGFSSVAPLGPSAAALLGGYLQTSSIGEVGSGRPSAKLLNYFAKESMVAVSGMTDSDPRAGYRREVCQFLDDRVSPAAKLGFIHGLLRGDLVEVRMFLERIESLFASLSDGDRNTPSFTLALDAIAKDSDARDRYLRFAEQADPPPIRARMIRMAGTLGWLSSEDQRAALLRMIGELVRRNAVGPAEVDLVCTLNSDGSLDPERGRLRLSPRESDQAANAAVLACLGSAESRVRVLQALTGSSDADAQIAEVYLGHHPVIDVRELREVAVAITQMTDADTQVRALNALALNRLSDRQSLDDLTGLFPVAATIDVQRAIAAVLIRSDYRSLARPEIARIMSQYRLKSPGGDDIIDILIRRLQAS